MEGISLRNVVVMGFLILGLVIREIEGQSCVGNPCFNSCNIFMAPHVCAKRCGCIAISLQRHGYEPTPADCYSGCRTMDLPKSKCKKMCGFPVSISDYCKSGCAFSVCENISTGFKNGAGEGEAKQAVEHCNNACSNLCDNGASKVQVATA